MVFLAGLGTTLAGLPPMLWTVVHLATALAGFWFAYKFKDNAGYMWGFTLYGVGALLYTFVHMGSVDAGATHYVETVLVFVAILLFGTKK